MVVRLATKEKCYDLALHMCMCMHYVCIAMYV